AGLPRSCRHHTVAIRGARRHGRGLLERPGQPVGQPRRGPRGEAKAGGGTGRRGGVPRLRAAGSGVHGGGHRGRQPCGARRFGAPARHGALWGDRAPRRAPLHRGGGRSHHPGRCRRSDRTGRGRGVDAGAWSGGRSPRVGDVGQQRGRHHPAAGRDRRSGAVDGTWSAGAHGRRPGGALARRRRVHPGRGPRVGQRPQDRRPTGGGRAGGARPRRRRALAARWRPGARPPQWHPERGGHRRHGCRAPKRHGRSGRSRAPPRSPARSSGRGGPRVGAGGARDGPAGDEGGRHRPPPLRRHRERGALVPARRGGRPRLRGFVLRERRDGALARPRRDGARSAARAGECAVLPGVDHHRRRHRPGARRGHRRRPTTAPSSM
ncbi:MAG: Cysteine desulfurase, partial [uncultured Acidimicrobiales bacterium]